MARNVTRRGQVIRDFILRSVQANPSDIGKLVQRKFKLSRQSASKYLNDLISDGLLEASGKTRARKYKLKTLARDIFQIEVGPNIQEDLEWRTKVRPLIEPHVAPNVLAICNHGFTEMLNNVLDHSGSKEAVFCISRTAVNVEIMIVDHGIGIFKKIQQDFNLNDPRHALLELSKGKLTSDKTRHSGEGIFFTSRMFDRFCVNSQRLFFSRTNTAGDWLIDVDENMETRAGTCVSMEIAIDSPRQTAEVFDRYASEFADYGFTKTHVPIKLGQYDDDQLVSRSAAKRLLARVNSFREVFLDFQGVTSIGQAFADEIFRVFPLEHPQVALIAINTNSDVAKMVQRATQNSDASGQLPLVGL